MTGIWILDVAIAMIVAVAILWGCNRLMVRFGWAPSKKKLDEIEARLKRGRKQR